MMKRRTPAAVVALAVAAAAFAAIPLMALVVRAPWTDISQLWDEPLVRQAVVRSVTLATVAAAVALVLGTAVGRVLAHNQGPWISVVRTLTTLPVVLPPVASGVALLAAFGRRGVAGDILEVFGLRLPFTEAAVVTAQVFVSLPFVVLVSESAFAGIDRAQTETATVLGAGPWRTLWDVELPSIRPSLGAAAALAWARCIGELGATLTFAGAVPGVTETMPLRILVELESRPEVATLLAVVLLVFAAVVLTGLRHQWLPTPRRDPS